MSHAPIRRLTSDEFDVRAKPAFSRVFRCADWECKEPFQEGVDARVIVDTKDDFELDEGQYDSVCRAAESVGDSHLFFSVLCCYQASEPMRRLTWEVPLFDFHAAYDQTVESIERSEIGMPLHRAMYSPTGSWGVWMPELYALVGGVSTFIRHFKQHYPDWHKDTENFVASFHEAAVARGVDISWVTPLLQHVYGDAASTFVENSSE